MANCQLINAITCQKGPRTTGVTVSGNTTTLAHDYEGRITTITYPNSSTNTFTYNGLDTRVGKVDSGGTKTYLRDGADVTDPVLSDGAANFTPGISERRSSTTKFMHQDRLGTTERLVNTSQSTTDTREYDAFGLLTASSGSTPTPFGFAGAWGYQEDADSGLKLLGHRYYDPSTGRFLTRDPVKAGRSWYACSEQNPGRFVDPDGLDIITFGWGGSGGAGGWINGGGGGYIDPGSGGWGGYGTYGGGLFAGGDTSLSLNFGYDWGTDSEPAQQSDGYAIGIDTPSFWTLEFTYNEEMSWTGLGLSAGYSPGAGVYIEKRHTSLIEIENPTTGSSLKDHIERLWKAIKTCIFLDLR